MKAPQASSPSAALAQPSDLAGISAAELAAVIEETAPLVQQNSAVAADRLRMVVAEAARRGLADVEAHGAYLCARAEVNQGRLAAALALIDRARQIWIGEGELLQAWRTDLGRMHVLDDLGRHADAIDVGEALVASLAAADLAGPEAEHAAWMRAAALENLGVGHGYMGDHEEALEAYAGAERTYREMGMLDEVPRPLGNRGVELVEVGRFQEALDALAAAAEGFADNEDALFVAKCLAYEARAHLLLGNYLGAAAATQRAHEYLDEQDTTTEYARTQLVRAETLTSLNLLEEALDLYDSVVPQLTAAGLRHDVADATMGRGVVLARLGRHGEAAIAFQQAGEVYREVGAPAMAATAVLAHAEFSEPDVARRLVDDSLDALRESGRSAELAAALVRKAQLAQTPHEVDRWLKEAAAILDEHDIPDVAWRAMHERARWLVHAGRLSEARPLLESALGVIDEARSTVVDERQRIFFMIGRDAVLEELLHLELDAGNYEAAYRRTEQARARTLVERLRGELPAAAVAPSSAELDSIYTDLLQAPSGRVADLRVRARRMEQQTLITAPVSSRPAAAAADAGRLFGPAVVTYQTLGDEIMAFTHRGDELTVVRRLTTVGEISDLLHQLDAQWRRFDDPGLAARQHRHLLAVVSDILQQLHIRLVAPLPAVPAGVPVMVVPCEPLGNVPFAALHDGVSHLVQRREVLMAPSLAVARHAAARRRVSHDRWLVVGVTDEHTPLVTNEVEEIAAAVGSATVLLDGDASVDALRNEVAVHDVVHIACHGVHRPDSPLFSALRLGDRWLTAAEVAGFELDGQLIVLSACSSGRQRGGARGDELIGLPRAFLAAGAGAVVVNLWPVDDASSRALMTRFHRNLVSLAPLAALRESQLDLMQQQPHPYYWAPAIMFGPPPTKEHLS